MLVSVLCAAHHSVSTFWGNSLQHISFRLCSANSLILKSSTPTSCCLSTNLSNWRIFFSVMTSKCQSRFPFKNGAGNWVFVYAYWRPSLMSTLSSRVFTVGNVATTSFLIPTLSSTCERQGTIGRGHDQWLVWNSISLTLRHFIETHPQHMIHDSEIDVADVRKNLNYTISPWTYSQYTKGRRW